MRRRGSDRSGVTPSTPLYVVKLGAIEDSTRVQPEVAQMLRQRLPHCDDRYYSKDVDWGGVPRAKATWLTKAQAEEIASVMRGRWGLLGTVEPLPGRW